LEGSETLLSEVQADEFILMGAGAAGAVKATALGLLQQGKTGKIRVSPGQSRNNVLAFNSQLF
jgi:hypothetical protein